MAKNDKVNIVIGAQDKTAGKLQQIQSKVLAIGAAYMGWRAVTGILHDIVQNGLESQKVYNDLSAAVERHGESWAGLKNKIEDFTGSMQSATGVSDELVAKGLQRLIDYGMTTAEAMQHMTTATDLAVGGNMDLMAAADLVGKSFVGYTGTLSRYGIIIDEDIPKAKKFTAAIEQMNQRFGGAAAARMETTAGKLDLLKERFGDLEEAIFDMASENGVLDMFLDKLSQSLSDAAVWLKSDISLWESMKMYVLGAIGAYGALGDAIVEAMDTEAAKSEETKNAQMEKARAIAAAEAEALQSRLASYTDFVVVKKSMIDDAAGHEVQTIQWLNEMEKNRATWQLQTHAKWLSSLKHAKTTEVQLNRGALALVRAEYEATEAKKLAAQQQFQQVSNQILAQSVDSMVDKLWEGSAQFDEIFKTMANHFIKFFIKQALASITNMFIPGLGALLGGIFDTRKNDMMAMTQGRHFGQFFNRGALEEITALTRAIPATLATGSGAVALAAPPSNGRRDSGGVTINFNGPVTDETFIRDTVVPIIVDSAVSGRGDIVTKRGQLRTGMASGIYN